MRILLAFTTVAIVLILGVGAVYADNPGAHFPESQFTKVRVSSAYKPPALRLPDIQALTQKALEADRSVLPAQLRKSKQVLAFFERPDIHWVLAPRQEKCWNVPWQRSCTIARHAVRLHTRLGEIAELRLAHELPLTNDWVTAVRIVQRAFPGTEGWLLSCSAAESSHGPWVRYGGGPYYPGYEHTNEVGSWLQYRWQTFRGHYRHGLESLRSRGFIADLPQAGDVRAWLSPLGVAVAGGWARWSGNDDAHWQASWNNGC